VKRAILCVLAAALLNWAAAAAQDEPVVSPIGDVEHLAEIIGGAHQIRQMCDSNDQTWRREMLALIDLEAKDDDRRQRRLIDAFNTGFRQQERIRQRCDSDARRAESELAAEGRRLAEQLRDRYLN